MFLKNYTSDVPVSQTIFRIEQVLIRCGVSGITKEYGPNSVVTAIRFHIKTAESIPELTVRLPANRERALDALWLDYADGEKLSEDGQRIHWNSRKRKVRNDFADQAERTAWKIVQDWVEVQMSMIQLKQAETVEVFMPYIWDGQQTVFGRIKANGYRALLPEKT
jgi:hypothetical protein